MDLADFAQSSAIGEAARSLSDRLLAPTIPLLRSYRPRQPGAFGAPLEEMTAEVEVPLAATRGVYGAGVGRAGVVVAPLVLCDLSLAPPEPRFLIDSPAAFAVISELTVGDVPSGTLVLGVRAPRPGAGPADGVVCRVGSVKIGDGTLGAIVSAAGTDAILTAGHVGSSMGATAASGANPVGTISFTVSPMSQPPKVPSADVAVITIGPRALSAQRLTIAVSGAAIRVSGAAIAGPGDSVELYSPRGVQRDTLFGFSSWVWSPQLPGTWADVYLTDHSISVGGDSGAPVLLQGTDELIGHVVGESANVTTFIQAIDCQLQAASCTLR
jgi:hypothetical protein